MPALQNGKESTVMVRQQNHFDPATQNVLTTRQKLKYPKLVPSTIQINERLLINHITVECN